MCKAEASKRSILLLLPTEKEQKSMSTALFFWGGRGEKEQRDLRIIVIQK